ncbi:MAG: amidohydrolase family protein [Proteobacteria bacterium]|nr:amidohydrolase family protein [Pseudomonadota bacterium]
MASEQEQDVENTGWVDTHVHIFGHDSALASDRRYAPAYDALPAQLLDKMARVGITRAVLVQPSFLGTDNSYILDAIASNPAAFCGIAVVEPDIGVNGLKALRRQGVLGVRFNCIGKAVPDFAAAHRELAGHLAALGMVLQIQAEGAQWAGMAAFLANPPGPVVIDHFGRTAPGHPSGGFETLMRAACQTDRLWFKFSAPYRLTAGAANVCAEIILKTVGIDRIVWGSDWPHTQHEEHQSYSDMLGKLADWVTSARDRQTVLVDNPAKLFRSGAQI